MSQLPELYKIYTIIMSNKSEHLVDGKQKETIMLADTDWIDLLNGSSINKKFMVEIKLNPDKTRENAFEFRDELLKIEQKQLEQIAAERKKESEIW